MTDDPVDTAAILVGAFCTFSAAYLIMVGLANWGLFFLLLAFFAWMVA